MYEALGIIISAILGIIAFIGRIATTFIGIISSLILAILQK